MGSSASSLFPLEAVETEPDPIPGTDRAGSVPRPCRPDRGFAAQCMALEL
jgi:hypothetical protein